MKRSNTQLFGTVLQEYLREVGWEKPLLEKKVVDMWPTLMGELVARFTKKVELKNGVLMVYLTSAPLRQELFLVRFELVKKLNDAVGSEIVKDVRLL